MYMNPNNGPSTRSARKSPRMAGERSLQGRVVHLDVDQACLEIEDERSIDRLRVGLRGARFAGLTDLSGDGQIDARDIFPGDRLRIRARTTQSGLLARRVEMLSSPGPAGGLRRLWPV